MPRMISGLLDRVPTEFVGSWKHPISTAFRETQKKLSTLNLPGFRV